MLAALFKSRSLPTMEVRMSNAENKDHRNAEGAQALLLAALRRVLPSTTFDEEALAHLAVLGRMRSLRLEEAVWPAQARADAIWLLLSGSICLGRRDARGQWQQSQMLGAGEWVDLASAWLGGGYQEEAFAAEPALVVAFPLAELQRLWRPRQGLWSGLMEAVVGSLAAQRLHLLQSQWQRSAGDSLGRAAAWLLAQQQAAGGQLQLRQRKKHIASEWGVTPETFSRTMKQLQRQGHISMQGYAVEIRDPAGLQRLARGEVGLPLGGRPAC